MQKLICELCRSNDFTKDDQGFFVCDYCRTKYTTAQAQSMMVEGTVRIDRSGEEASLITLSSRALTSGSFQEAFDCASRALEIDPQSTKAWCIKGAAAGWLSTLHALRLKEMRSTFDIAIQSASEVDRFEVQQWCAERVDEMAMSFTEKALDYAKQYPWDNGAWEAYVALSEEALGLLEVSFYWSPRPQPLLHYVSIASDLVRGINSVAGSQWLAHSHRSNLQQRIDWAGDYIRHFHPDYVTPRPRPSKFFRI